MLKVRFNFTPDIPDEEQTTLEASHVCLNYLLKKVMFDTRKKLLKLNFGATGKASTATRNAD